MAKPSLAQYTIAELEDYIKARKIVEQYENSATAKQSAPKPTKVKGEKPQRKRRGSINAADVLNEVKNSMPKGINGAKLQKKLGTSYPTLKNWLEKNASDNHIVREKAEKGAGFVYKLKA